MEEKSMHDRAPERESDCPYPETPIEALGNWAQLIVGELANGSAAADFSKLVLPSDYVLGVEIKLSAECPLTEPLVLRSLMINKQKQATVGNRFSYRDDEKAYAFNAKLVDLLDLSEAPDTVSIDLDICRFDATKVNDLSGKLTVSVFTA